jgi:hypothetical protein
VSAASVRISNVKCRSGLPVPPDGISHAARCSTRSAAFSEMNKAVEKARPSRYDFRGQRESRIQRREARRRCRSWWRSPRH